MAWMTWTLFPPRIWATACVYNTHSHSTWILNSIKQVDLINYQPTSCGYYVYKKNFSGKMSRCFFFFFSQSGNRFLLVRNIFHVWTVQNTWNKRYNILHKTMYFTPSPLLKKTKQKQNPIHWLHSDINQPCSASPAQEIRFEINVRIHKLTELPKANQQLNQ